MRLGLIARADNSGLGIQTHEFYRHMRPHKTMVVDISKLNGNKQYPERYPYATFIKGFPQQKDIDDFLKDLDVVFIAEAAYSFYLFSRARELGVKTAVQYNYEFFDWYNAELPAPDLLIAPSRWHYAEVQLLAEARGIQHAYLHCPVNRSVLPFREIPKFKTFLHNAGRSAAYDRNGTETVIEASKHVKSDVRIIIHFQGEQGLSHQATRSVEEYKALASQKGGKCLRFVSHEYEDYFDAYAKGDVMLLPRRYGGNCLPLNEALSVGMPVIMPAISPNDWLPHEWLVPAERIGEFTPRTRVDIYGCDPKLLAKKIDEFAGMSTAQAKAHNLIANGLADRISWQTLAPKYAQVLRDLCTR